MLRNLLDYEDDFAFQAKAKSEKGSHENILYLCYSTLQQFLDRKNPYCITWEMEMTLEIFIPWNLICKPASGQTTNITEIFPYDEYILRLGYLLKISDFWTILELP